MKKKSIPTLLILSSACLTTLLSLATEVCGQDVKNEMTSLLAPLRKLQPFLVDGDKFAAPENNDTILALLNQIRGDFHSLETIPSRFHRQPGFDSNVRQVASLLDDATRRFSEGKASYAWWRVRSLPGACFACHATYQVTTTYSNDAVIDPSLDVINKARFLLATRQFAAAQVELTKVLEDPAYRFYSAEALRSLLVVATRINKDPAKTIEIFKALVTKGTLAAEDTQEVERWLVALEAWKKEKSPPQTTLAVAEKLIVAGMSKGIDYNRDDVSLLRGTALLHVVLEREGVTPQERRRSLYLLGLSYTQLPMFFTDGWAEMYLEQCINEFPDTEDARRAFKAYKSAVVDEFTGSGGVHVTPEVQLRLDQLRQKAYGQPAFSGKV